MRKISARVLVLTVVGLLSNFQDVVAASSGSAFEGVTLEDLRQILRSTSGPKIYLGDLIVYREDAESILRLGEVEAKAAIGGRALLWPQGAFVYQFNGQTDDQRSLFRAACAAWTVGTPLQCIERTTQRNFASIVTHNGSGCNNSPNVSCSMVGMRRCPPEVQECIQDIEIYSGHWASSSQHVISHEIGHALGLIHEQARSDRDNYVIYSPHNVQSGKEHNFQRDSNSRNPTDYDYESVMHYGNCFFAKNSPCDSENRATESNWTLTPIPCARDRLGGNSITALDLDGIRNTYAAPVQALYPRSRRLQCGVHVYSKAQVLQVCGTDCKAATAVTWSRIHTEYDWGCGWITIRDGKKFCEGRKQELRDQWYDKDPFHGRCWGGTLVERWTECGCSTQVLQADCADFSADVDLVQLQKLVHSADPTERRTGHFVETLLSYRDGEYLSLELSHDLPAIFINAFVQSSPETMAAILCDIKVELTLQRILDKKYQMSARRFYQITARYGLSFGRAPQA